MCKFDPPPAWSKDLTIGSFIFKRVQGAEGIFKALRLYEHSLTHGSKILFWTYGSQYAPWNLTPNSCNMNICASVSEELMVQQLVVLTLG